MHSKIKQEKGSKHLFHIRFMQKIGKTNKLIVMKQQQQQQQQKTDWLLIISNFFLISKFSKNKFTKLCIS